MVVPSRGADTKEILFGSREYEANREVFQDAIESRIRL
jgi:hypothetical protein